MMSNDHSVDVTEPRTLTDPPSRSRFLGCLLGGALGDALGYPIEICKLPQILTERGATTPQRLASGDVAKAQISDETQLSLFTAEGIIVARRAGLSISRWTQSIRAAYLRWYTTQQIVDESERVRWTKELEEGWLLSESRMHEQRQPETTCLAALQRTFDAEHRYDVKTPPNSSRRCGAVNRMAPVGLAAHTEAEAFEVGRDAGALTHGHPDGYLPGAYYAVLIHHLIRGVSLLDAMDRADRLLCREDGKAGTTAMLGMARTLAKAGPPSPAVIESMGGGWVGDEALSIALLCALTADMSAPDAVAHALWRAACHSGDSDSTASLCGSLLGAAHGVERLPASWLDQLELADVVERVASELHDAALTTDKRTAVKAPQTSVPAGPHFASFEDVRVHACQELPEVIVVDGKAWRLVDRIDVTDVESEKAHDFVIRDAKDSYRTRQVHRYPDGTAITDNGRAQLGGHRSFRVKNLVAGRALAMIWRLDYSYGNHQLELVVDGNQVGTTDISGIDRSCRWRNWSHVIPGDRIAGPEISIKQTDPKGQLDISVFRYWFFQAV